MIQSIPYKIRLMRGYTLFFIILVFLGTASCENNTGKQTQASANDSVISSITGVEQFNEIIKTSGERLLVFDFYADWCPPCKDLEPILEKIAKEKREIITIYKINIDRNKDLANSFHVTGIPHVAFMKNKKNILSLTGLYPKNMYLKVIERYTEAGES